MSDRLLSTLADLGAFAAAAVAAAVYISSIIHARAARRAQEKAELLSVYIKLFEMFKVARRFSDNLIGGATPECIESVKASDQSQIIRFVRPSIAMPSSERNFLSAEERITLLGYDLKQFVSEMEDLAWQAECMRETQVQYKKYFDSISKILAKAGKGGPVDDDAMVAVDAEDLKHISPFLKPAVGLAFEICDSVFHLVPRTLGLAANYNSVIVPKFPKYKLPVIDLSPLQGQSGNC